MATRIWWTSSGSSPSRTPGSCARRRTTESTIAACAIAAALESAVGLGGVDDVGRLERARAERAHDLGDEVGEAGTGGAQSRRDRIGHAFRGVGLQLHLELAEPRHEARAVEHRHFVVDDLTERLAGREVAQHDASRAG